jgi:S-adenosyl-L-methionine hydrolase (adenosine-forming)
VILGIAPAARLVDRRPEIPPHDIASGAWVLHTAWRYFPASAIFRCVVDHGVGGARRPIALAAGDRAFGGPENGLFSYALREAPPCTNVTRRQPARR